MPPRVGDELIADLLRSIPDDTTTTDRVLERLFVSRAGDDGSSGWHASAAPRDTSVRDKKHKAAGPNPSIHFAGMRRAQTQLNP
jgi:hypothetical protein